MMIKKMISYSSPNLLIDYHRNDRIIPHCSLFMVKSIYYSYRISKFNLNQIQCVYTFNQ